MILSSVLMGQRKVVSTLHHLSPGPYWELQVHRCIDNTAAHTYRLRYTSAHTQALPHKGTKIHTKGSQNIKHHTHTRTHTDIKFHTYGNKLACKCLYIQHAPTDTLTLLLGISQHAIHQPLGAQGVTLLWGPQGAWKMFQIPGAWGRDVARHHLTVLQLAKRWEPVHVVTKPQWHWERMGEFHRARTTLTITHNTGGRSVRLHGGC